MYQQLSLFEPDACQRWQSGTPTWRRPEDGGFTAARYHVVEIDTPTARRFVITHHYSRSYPVDRRRYGLIEGDQLLGVAVLGEPMHPKVTGKVFPTLDRRTTAELSRFVLLDQVPSNAETWLLRRVFGLAAAGGLRGVVAFPDPMPRHNATGQLIMPGHVGHIYRAHGGGRYTGRATQRTLTLMPDGRVLSDRSRAKVTGSESGAAGVIRGLVAYGATPPNPAAEPRVWLAQALAEIGARRQRHRGNHRFAWTLGSSRQRRRTPIALPALPYPTTPDATV
ncbi:Mom family adenine methylcarbamoylation protein [Hamadaea tsunoensis]|uniref:Mom family adenine methylcarbamoylation protein n=1 Tax=Hamadaea tsunoensis TaxID=53368 RepID=UPI0003FD6103|nr:hypothetical protein [Hamadaea tsunoensis]